MSATKLFTLCASVGFAHVALADSLPIRNLNPLLSGYELPPALPSTVPTRMTLGASYAIANISQNQRNPHEAVQLDGELQRWQFDFNKSLNDSLGLRIELPYVKISGGHLDHFIESFHKTFGLPNGNRNLWPTNRLLIHYEANGVTAFDLHRAQQGIGDLTVRLGQRLGGDATEARFNNMVWLSLKLPTGDADKLTGSGSTDIALSFSASQRLSDSFTAQQQLSLSILGKGDRLRDQQNTAVWSGSLGIDATLTQHWGAIVQFDGSTKAVSTDLRSLGPALQLSFGPRYRNGAWLSELVISEDIAVDTAPDVQFQLDIARKWR